MKWIMEYTGRACWMLVYGDVAGAERHAKASRELGTQIGEPDALMMYGAQIVPIRILQGRHEEILGVLDQAVEANPRIVGSSAAKAQILGLLGRTSPGPSSVSTRAGRSRSPGNTEAGCSRPGPRPSSTRARGERRP